MNRASTIHNPKINRKYNRLSSIETPGENQSNTYFHHPPTIFQSFLNFRKSLFCSQIFSRASYPSKPLGGTIPIKAREHLGVMGTPPNYYRHRVKWLKPLWTMDGGAALMVGVPPQAENLPKINLKCI